MIGNFVANNTRPVGTHVTTSTDTTLLTAVGYTQVLYAHVANISGSDESFTLSWRDDSAAATYVLLSAHVVPANGSVQISLPGLSLDEDDTLIGKSAGGGDFDVTVVIAEIPGRSG